MAIPRQNEQNNYVKVKLPIFQDFNQNSQSVH